MVYRILTYDISTACNWSKVKLLPICRSAPAEHPGPMQTDGTRTDANAGTTTPHGTATTPQIRFEAVTKKATRTENVGAGRFVSVFSHEAVQRRTFSYFQTTFGTAP